MFGAENIVGVYVEYKTKIGKRVERRHCPAGNVLSDRGLPYAQLAGDFRLRNRALFYGFRKPFSYLFRCNHLQTPFLYSL